MIAVIGDIHGCYYTLTGLVKKIREQYKEIPLYCVGDLVDRGNFSFEVVEFVIKENILFTPGNHDYMFYYFIKHPQSDLGKAWIYNGSEKTILSYEDRGEEVQRHLDLIIDSPLYLNLEDCFISHAGISRYYKSKMAKKPLSDIEKLHNLIYAEINNQHGVLWNRDTLLDIGKLQIVGHTRQKDVMLVKSNNAAYLDTSAFTGNKLSAVIVENSKIIDLLTVPTSLRDIE